MATFIETPSYIYTEEIRYETTKIDNENGSDVTNSRRTPTRIFKLNFDRIDLTTRNAILDFWDARKGSYESFTWNNPNDSTNYTVRFIENSLVWREPEYQFYNIRLSFIEVI